MPKAKLVTRASSTSTVTEDTLNKGSALTHAEMDSNLINLRDSSFGIADDSSTVLQVTADKTITIAGSGSITTALSGDTLTISGTDNNTVTALNNQTENRLVTMGATTTELDGEANLTFDGSTLAVTGNITATTSIANDAITIDDNKITTTRSNDKLIFDTAGTGPIDFSNNFLINVSDPFAAQDVATKNYVDTQDAAIASDTLTFTNKTFDANGTGNSISNIETADIAASTLVTAAEGIGSNNNDTTIPTSAAVKAYADSVGGGGGATGLTFVGDDSTGTLISDGETIKIAGGTGITTAMSGDTLTITASGGGGASTGDLTFTGSTISSPSNADITLDPGGTGDIVTPAITIHDNEITTNRTNDPLALTANGTGFIVLGDTGSEVDINERYGCIKVHKETVDASAMTSFNDHRRANTTKSLYTLSGSSSGSDAIFQQNLSYTLLDVNGYSLTGTQGTEKSSGPSNKVSTTLSNNGGTASNLEEGHGMFNLIDTFSFGGSTLTVDHAILNGSYLNAYPNTTVNNGYGYRTYGKTFDFGGGPGVITNFYGFYMESSGAEPTNTYAFYDATNSLSVFGDIQTQGVSITDNKITSNRSNDNLEIDSNGSGLIEIGKSGNTVITGSGSLSPNEVGCVSFYTESLDPSTQTNLNQHRTIHSKKADITLTASSTQNDSIYRHNLGNLFLNVAGYSLTGTYSNVGSGAQNKISTQISNTGGTASTVAQGSGLQTGVSTFSFGGSTLTCNSLVGNAAFIETFSNCTVDDGYGFYSYANTGAGGTVTDFYAFYAHDSGSNATNTYAFWDATNSLSRFGAVILANQASDPSTVTDSAHIYAKDVSASSEVFVRDEAGNVTQISPHNEQGEWQYYSVNEKTGKTVRVNMEKMIRKLEEITGETFIENH